MQDWSGGRARLGVWLGLSLLVATGWAPQLGAQTRVLDLTDGGWELIGEGTAVETFAGRTALRIGTGRAIRRDVAFQDGTIEFDMSVTPDRTFVYLQLRMQSDEDHEEFYFRPHKSGLPDALQYTPVIGGQSSWQLYHGPGSTAAAALAPERWIHVRVVVQGNRAAMFLNGASEPALVSRLTRDVASGYLALRGFIPAGSPAPYSVYYSNIVVRPGEVNYDFPALPPARAVEGGWIETWSVSPAFAAGEAPITTMPKELGPPASWARFPVEPQGALELFRHVERPEGVPFWGVVAHVTLFSDRARLAPLQLGFSDVVTVLLNGQPLYFASQTYSPDAPRREGLLGLDQATVYLPLRQGDNYLSVVVADRFGGWAVMGRLAEWDGITIR